MVQCMSFVPFGLSHSLKVIITKNVKALVMGCIKLHNDLKMYFILLLFTASVQRSVDCNESEVESAVPAFHKYARHHVGGEGHI